MKILNQAPLSVYNLINPFLTYLIRGGYFRLNPDGPKNFGGQT